MDTVEAVQTCILSKNWKSHWTHVHNLVLDYTKLERKRYDNNNNSDFTEFVLTVLLHLKSCRLKRLRIKGTYNYTYKPSLLETIFRYAKSHGIEELETDRQDRPLKFPPTLSDCPTLKTLRLNNCGLQNIGNSFHFASLTTFEISGTSNNQIKDLLSRCLNLENLFLSGCTISANDPQSFALNISLPKLVNLTMSSCSAPIFNITAPRLVNLVISNRYGNQDTKLVISAPRLRIFNNKGYPSPQLSMNETPNLYKVDIHMFAERCQDRESFFSDLNSMAEALSHAKSLTVSFQLSESVIAKDKFGVLLKNFSKGGFDFDWQLC